MKPLRLVLNVVGFVLAPAFAAGALVFYLLDRLDAGLTVRQQDLAAEVASWSQPRSCP